MNIAYQAYSHPGFNQLHTHPGFSPIHNNYGAGCACHTRPTLPPIQSGYPKPGYHNNLALLQSTMTALNDLFNAFASFAQGSYHPSKPPFHPTKPPIHTYPPIQYTKPPVVKPKPHPTKPPIFTKPLIYLAKPAFRPSKPAAQSPAQDLSRASELIKELGPGRHGAYIIHPNGPNGSWVVAWQEGGGSKTIHVNPDSPDQGKVYYGPPIGATQSAFEVKGGESRQVALPRRNR